MLKNKLFKYKLNTFHIRNLHICTLYLCALLGTLSAPVAHANSPCADLVPPSSKEQGTSTTPKEQSSLTPKEQSSLTPKEQNAPAHFGLDFEPTSHGKDTLLLSASIRDTFGFASSSKTPMEQTKDFESYIGVLLEHQIIEEPQLTQIYREPGKRRTHQPHL